MLAWLLAPLDKDVVACCDMHFAGLTVFWLEPIGPLVGLGVRRAMELTCPSPHRMTGLTIVTSHRTSHRLTALVSLLALNGIQHHGDLHTHCGHHFGAH